MQRQPQRLQGRALWGKKTAQASAVRQERACSARGLEGQGGGQNGMGLGGVVGTNLGQGEEEGFYSQSKRSWGYTNSSLGIEKGPETKGCLGLLLTLAWAPPWQSTPGPPSSPWWCGCRHSARPVPGTEQGEVQDLSGTATVWVA